jgi:hypothetical protein
LQVVVVVVQVVQMLLQIMVQTLQETLTVVVGLEIELVQPAAQEVEQLSMLMTYQAAVAVAVV